MIYIGIVFIILALIFYTSAVWIEKINRKLNFWIVSIFTSGFICDLVGTSIMFYIAKNKFDFNVHSVFGYLALIIMLFHLIWAILAKRNKKYEEYFTKFSIFAWILWMIAFLTGLILNIK